MAHSSVRISWIASLIGMCIGSLPACAQQVPDPVPAFINDSQLVTLPGNVHPLARAEFDQGPIDPESHLSRLILLLQPAVPQAELDAFLAAQQDPSSPQYRRWLTPAEFAARFGARPADSARVTAWLRTHGFSVDETPAGNRWVIFSATAGQVEEAFHTSLHRYAVDGESHLANAQDPQIPQALADVIAGIVSLHNFRRVSASTPFRALSGRDQSSGNSSYLTPAGFAALYDLNPVYDAGIQGSGVTLAVLGRSNIRLDDVAAFRAALGLPAHPTEVILDGYDPGMVASDEQNATLGVEWAGTLAPEASIQLIAAASSETTDGVDLAAQFAVNHPSAAILSVGYASCETSMGATERAFYQALWQQAASEGITVIVASGNSGAACEGLRGETTGVNGLCASPYATCVGGTEFTAKLNSDSIPAILHDAPFSGDLPEQVWNERESTPNRASGGGFSRLEIQPAWQRGVAGIAGADGMRAVPDLGLHASAQDGLITLQHGVWGTAGGTAGAAAAFAAMVALVAQSDPIHWLGAVNPLLYRLSQIEPAAYHATSSGDNSVPGVPGFAAQGDAYNLATGLGSVNGSLFVRGLNAELRQSSDEQPANLPAPSSSPPSKQAIAPGGATPRSFSGSPGIELSSSPGIVDLTLGSTAGIAFTLTPVGSFRGPVSLAVSALPAGVSASWSANPVLLGASGPQSVTLSLAANAAAQPVGNATFVVTATGQNIPSRLVMAPRSLAQANGHRGPSPAPDTPVASTVCNLAVVPAPEMQLSNAVLTLPRASTANIAIQITQTGSISASVDLSLGAPPVGVALGLGDSVAGAGGVMSATLAIAGSAFAHPGTYTLPIGLTLTNTGGISTTAWTAITLSLQ